MYSRGESEEIVGKALKRCRDDVVLATKVRFPVDFDPRGSTPIVPNRSGASRVWLIRALEGSLRRLGTDHVDLLQIHQPDPDTDIEETLSALSDLVRAGKVRTIGTSSLPASDIVQAQWLGVPLEQRSICSRFRAASTSLGRPRRPQARCQRYCRRTTRRTQ